MTAGRERRSISAKPGITAYITDAHVPPTHFVLCPVCGGAILFNLAEVEARRANRQSTSVYCGGRWVDPVTGSNELTRKGSDPHNHWHPSFPPEPIYEWGYAVATPRRVLDPPAVSRVMATPGSVVSNPFTVTEAASPDSITLTGDQPTVPATGATENLSGTTTLPDGTVLHLLLNGVDTGMTATAASGAFAFAYPIPPNPTDSQVIDTFTVTN